MNAATAAKAQQYYTSPSAAPLSYVPTTYTVAAQPSYYPQTTYSQPTYQQPAYQQPTYQRPAYQAATGGGDPYELHLWLNGVPRRVRPFPGQP